MKRRVSKNYNSLGLSLIMLVLSLLVLYFMDVINTDKKTNNSITEPYSVSYTLDNIPEYNGKDFVYINDNEPSFTEEEKNMTETFEKYSELDYLNRCGVAFANIGQELMPTEERGKIGSVKPSGWQTVKYDFINGKYLYNRCHLIGFQLTAENDNSQNLITCTRQMNTETMLDYENKVAKYIKKTGNHVLYRVTPVFYDSNLLATGVQMEGYSVEDSGKGIKFNIFVYNVQDGVEINYENGNSKEIVNNE